MRIWIAFSLIVCTGCFQKSSEDNTRTVPVTNNPNIVPDKGPSIPGIPRMR